jgi:predicted lactoylglutathione lyase
VRFFTALGYSFSPRFTNESATCMIVSEDIYIMLLTHAAFQQFTPKPICDATQATEVLVALSYESRDAVDEMVRKAVAAGGTSFRAPQDHGFMYHHAYQDPDGHIWQLAWMSPEAVTQD